MPQQEKGSRPACALPYELNVMGDLSADKTFFLISMAEEIFYLKITAAGAPFIVYSYGKEFKTKNYAVSAGDQLFDKTLLTEFEDGNYDIRLIRPKWFLPVFKGNKNDPPLLIRFQYEDANWNEKAKAPNLPDDISMNFINPDMQNHYKIKIVDNTYHSFEPIIKDIPNVNESRLQQLSCLIRVPIPAGTTLAYS